MLSLLKLSQALNSRLCHEIAGLVGSISTGVALVTSTNSQIKNKAHSMLSTMPKELISTVNFYRIAYGVSQEQAHISLEEIKILCESFLNNNVEFSVLCTKELLLSIELGKIIMCLIVSINKLLLKNGAVMIQIEQNAKYLAANIEVTGAYLKIEPSKQAILIGQNDGNDLDVDNSNEYYVYYLGKSLGLNIEIKQNVDKILFSILNNNNLANKNINNSTSKSNCI